MKYMTFNSSCSYAGVANMLEIYGIDVEDYQIAITMDLPYLIAKDEHGFISGPMLQSKKWFDLYLNTVGFALKEVLLDKAEVYSYIAKQRTAMLGIRIDEENKHAVVFSGISQNKASFINNKKISSNEPDAFLWSEDELIEHLDEKCVVATLEHCDKQEADHTKLLQDSIRNLESLKEHILLFCQQEQSRENMMQTLNTLFRPILLDSISVLELIHENQLVDKLKKIQGQYITVAFQEKALKVILADKIDLQELAEAIDDWIQIILQKIKCSIP